MYISVIANVINVAGNLIGVFFLRAGVAGVAYPSLLARAFSAVIITFLCFSGRNPIQYRGQWMKITLVFSVAVSGDHCRHAPGVFHPVWRGDESGGYGDSLGHVPGLGASRHYFPAPF